MSWPLDSRTGAIVAQAAAQHFTIKCCERCGGPEIFSKLRPLARCFRCGTQRQLEKVAPMAKRRQCRSCRKFFRQVWASLVCPDCIAKDERAAVKDRKRSRPRKVVLKSPAITAEMLHDEPETTPRPSTPVLGGQTTPETYSAEIGEPEAT